MHLGLLHRIARGFAPPADQHDLLQELMLTVWKAMPAFRGDSGPATFVYRVAHNRALTWHRQEGARARRDADAAAEATWRAEGDGDQGRLLDRLYAAIRRLPALDRSLLLLSLDGVSYRDIGLLHDLSETNVGARLTRARARLTRMIDEEEEAEDHGF